MTAHERYLGLVEKVKTHAFPDGLVNPFNIGGKNLFRDQNQINPWSVWQNNLEAKILVIGKDWGSVDYFRQNHGRDNDANPTNMTLQNLLAAVGYDPGLFSQPNPQPLFFYDCCTRNSRRQSHVRPGANELVDGLYALYSRTFGNNSPQNHCHIGRYSIGCGTQYFQG